MLCAACSTSSLSGPGAKVSMTSLKPTNCKSLGLITGKGGGSWGGGYIKNEKLVEYALNDLRNEAAERGATHVQQPEPQFGSSNGTTTTVTVVAEAFVCKGEPVMAAAPAPAPSKPAAPAPVAPAPAAPAPVVATGVLSVEAVPNTDPAATRLHMQLALASDAAALGTLRVRADVAAAQVSGALVVELAASAAPDPAACDVVWVVDGTKLELGPLAHSSEGDRARYETPASLEQIVTVQKAGRVAGKVCETRFTLEPAERAKLTELVLRAQEERTLQEPAKPRVGSR